MGDRNGSLLDLAPRHCGILAIVRRLLPLALVLAAACSAPHSVDAGTAADLGTDFGIRMDLGADASRDAGVDRTPDANPANLPRHCAPSAMTAPPCFAGVCDGAGRQICEMWATSEVPDGAYAFGGCTTVDGGVCFRGTCGGVGPFVGPGCRCGSEAPCGPGFACVPIE